MLTFTSIYTDGRPPERDHPVEAAIRHARSYLGELNLDVQEENLGDAELPVMNYTARDCTGRLVAVGTGKGTGAQCTASGLFELIEVYHFDWRNQSYREGDIRFMGAAEIASQAALRPAAVIQRTGQALQGLPLHARRYVSVRDPDDQVLFPTFLREPAYPHHIAEGDGAHFSAFRRYCSAAGFASGTTVTEALLHAACELVEHDSLSFKIADWYLSPNSPPVIHRVNLPEASLAARLQAAVSGRLETAVWLIDITTDIGIPAYMAICPSRTDTVAKIGMGASLMADYAAERALLELWQSHAYHAFSLPNSAARDNAIKDRVCRWEWMERAVALNVTELSTAGKIIDVGLPQAWPRADSASLLDEVMRRLEQKKIHVYYRHACTRPGDVIVTDVLAPGLELLDLIRFGWPQAPTGRLARSG